MGRRTRLPRFLGSALAAGTVAPLLPEEAAPAPIGELNPVPETTGGRHVRVAQAIAAISAEDLGILLIGF